MALVKEYIRDLVEKKRYVGIWISTSLRRRTTKENRKKNPKYLEAVEI